MNNPLVSVITPVYNTQAFIGPTIESVMNQTYANWEMLVIDDGSTDATQERIEEYLSDSRIKYLYQKNQERAVARNHGLRRATGKYVAFLDADDLWLPDKLKVQVKYLEARPQTGLCFTRYRLIDSKGRLLGTPPGTPVSGEDQFYHLLRGRFVANSAVLVPRWIFEEVGLFDETLPVFGAEDWDMWLRIARRYLIHQIDQPLMLYRIHEGNTALDNMCLSSEAVLKKVFSDPSLPSHVVEAQDEVFSAFHLGYSQAYLKRSQRKAALRHWRLAFQARPQQVFATPRGVWATLKLCLPYLLVANLPRLRNLLNPGAQ